MDSSCYILCFLIANPKYKQSHAWVLWGNIYLTLSVEKLQCHWANYFYPLIIWHTWCCKSVSNISTYLCIPSKTYKCIVHFPSLHTLGPLFNCIIQIILLPIRTHWWACHNPSILLADSGDINVTLWIIPPFDSIFSVYYFNLCSNYNYTPSNL